MTDTLQIDRPQRAASEWALRQLIRHLAYDGAVGRLVDDQANIHRLMADAIKADPETFAADWQSVGESCGDELPEINGYEDELAEGRRMINAVAYHLMEAERLAGVQSSRWVAMLLADTD